MLASSIRSPALYDPQSHPDAAKARWKFVLDGMVSMGKLSQADETKQKYPTVRKKTSGTAGRRPEVLGRPRRGPGARRARPGRLQPGQAQRRRACGSSPRSTSGPRTPRSARCRRRSPTRSRPTRPSNCGRRWSRCSRRPATCLAYWGGPNGLGTDYAQAWRQAGSAFKPYVLATALTQTLDPETPDDKKISVYKTYDGSSPQTFNGTEVANSEGAQCNPCSVMDAMRRSINTVFYRMGIDAGPANVADDRAQDGHPGRAVQRPEDPAGEGRHHPGRHLASASTRCARSTRRRATACSPPAAAAPGALRGQGRRLHRPGRLPARGQGVAGDRREGRQRRDLRR